MYLEGRNYRSVISNAVLFYMYNGTALYILCKTSHAFFYSPFDSN